MTFLYPAALLLLVPVGLLLWWFGLPRGPGALVRVLVAGSLVVALAGPSVEAPGGGRDVFVVVDRSRSMPKDADLRATEVVRRLEQRKGPRDRVAVIAVGREARVERPPDAVGTFGGFQRALDGDGSDLGAALEMVDGLAERERETRVLVLSDGLHTTGDPTLPARRLGGRGVPVDYRWSGRDTAEGDVSVAPFDLPSQVTEGEPFQFGATVHASKPRDVSYILRRGDAVLAKGRMSLRPGPNRLSFRDRIERAGLAEYQLLVEGASDAVPENDRARGLVRVEGKPRVLVVRTDGREGALAKALRDSGLLVATSDTPPKTLESLDGVDALVLENVPASALGEQGLRVVSTWVREAGGGLVLTGGRRSFGEGGYHKSVLEEVLPVTMELREEQHRSSIALGISMDRSGSMTATTAEGRTKMSLAAEGAAGALALLQSQDEAATWVVDTSPHVIFPLTKVSDGLPLDLVASVVSEGGGIYVGEALKAAAEEMLKSRKATRHIILFSDAADSEEPGDYKETLARLAAAKVTVSVIGLGSTGDPDAALLLDVATRGGGRLSFAESGAELPRLFSEETILLSRSAFVDQPTPTAVAPDYALLGSPPSGTPTPGGYNLTYARPTANVALRTTDEYAAPVVAFWNTGVGRAAVLTAEADGEFTGKLRDWPGYRALLSQLVRRVAASKGKPDVLAKARREGQELHVILETSDAAATLLQAPSVSVLSGDGRMTPRTLELRRESAHRLGVRIPLDASGSLFPVVRVGDEVLRVAPVALSYATEFEPRDPNEGKSLLVTLAKLTGGQERLSVEGLFTAEVGQAGRRSVATWFVVFALLLALAEIVLRRLFPAWSPQVALPQRPLALVRRVLPATPTRPTNTPPPPPPSSPGPPPVAPKPPASGVQGALDKARDRAKRRLD